jgi:hypothetical protein
MTMKKIIAAVLVLVSAGSKKARSFVQINSGLSAAEGVKAKGVVDGL